MPKAFPGFVFILVVSLIHSLTLHGQIMPPTTLPGIPSPRSLLNNNDSLGVDSMRSDWVDEQAKIYYKLLNSDVRRYPDTTIHYLHHFQQTQPWWGLNLGNYGTAAENLLFTPNQTIGPSLGYRIYDLYKLDFDSLRYYNTTRPYSAFSFMLGSKEQQNVEILHTQNITPRWNFAARIRYFSSKGFYALQKAKNMGGSFNTNYASKNERYQFKAAFLYNRFTQGENGGIQSDSFLNLSTFSDRQRIPVNLPERSPGSNVAAVSNMWRSLDLYVENNYSWGQADTTYNDDSTKATYHFTPRFRLQHELRIHGEKHLFKDYHPDSIRYAFIQPISFTYGDSLFSRQDWVYVDSKLSLNGFIGKEERLTRLQAGIGNRIDRFTQNRLRENDHFSSFSNYLFGRLKKEAYTDKQWSYQADAAFYFTGKAAGNFQINAFASKGFGKWGTIAAGVGQTLANPSFASTHFNSNYFERNNDFQKTDVTKLWGGVTIPALKIQLTLNNYLITNYIYYDENYTLQQSASAFSLTQLSGRKIVSYGIFSWDNEVVWQQLSGNAPIHLPAFMLREQLKVEAHLFKNALLVATGVEARYTTPYFSNGYSPYFNQFYIQDKFKTHTLPEISLFFNFRVRNFRAYITGGQLQQLISSNNIPRQGYPSQDALLRFGFIWVLIN